MPSYFELCIKVNTLPRARRTRTRNHTHTHTQIENPSMDSQPLYMESSNHSQVRMICK